jgi:hypothetical protein
MMITAGFTPGFRERLMLIFDNRLDGWFRDDDQDVVSIMPKFKIA